MQLQPYLFFDGRCEEAIGFYQRTLGARVDMLVLFKDSPEPPQPGTVPPGSEDKVMHATLTVGDTKLLVSDGHCTGKPTFEGFALTVEVPDAATAERVFGALADGGQVRMPLSKTFFSPSFGMAADRFGVTWMVIVPA